MKQNYNLSTYVVDSSSTWNFFTHKSKALLVFTLLFTFLGFSDAFGQFNLDVTTPGGPTNFTVPAGVTSVTAAVWGAGGGGGGSSANGFGGNGGGGGGASSATFAVLPTQIITYRVGQGGNGGSSVGSSGSNGTLSSIIHTNSGTTLTGNFGNGGQGNAAVIIAPASSGGTGVGGANSNGLNGTRVAATGGSGGNSGTALGIFGTGPAGNNNNNGTNGGTPGAGASGGEFGGGLGRTGGRGADGRIVLRYISVTSIAPSTVCVGSTITITGTNFASGISTVTINGTSCTGVTWINSTTITAVVGVGTTSGTVLITNPNGTNNGQTLTVTPQPAAIAGGSATVCVGATTPAFTNSVSGGTWSITNGTGSATISAGGVVTGVTTGSATVVYTIGTCTATTGITINATPTITGNPANSSIAVGAATSFTVAATNTPTGYTWEVSTDGGGTWTTVTNGGVYTNATTATLNITGATLAMNGYRYRASATNGCGTSAFCTSATLTVSITYCTPTATTDDATGVTNVTFNTINNSTVGTPAYNDFTAISTSLVGTVTYPLSVRVNTAGNFTVNARAWIDWNLNGTFDVAEEYNLGSAINVVDGVTSGSPLNILIPNTPGTYRMRVRAAYNVIPTACGNQNYSETEDYNLVVVAAPPCVAPTAQPTALALTPAGSTIAGSFTAASPAANSYLVVVSTSATPPSAPVNGTSYTIGGTLAPGYIIVDNDTNTSFSATGLTPLTAYYFYIYSFNNLCTGGPLYLGTSPLTGNTTTTTADYCTPTIGAAYATSTNHHIRRVEFIGTLQDVTNTSTFTTVAPIGYENYTGLAVKSIQAKGEGVNIYMESPNSGYIKAWVDWNADGDFLDATETVYDAGGVSQASTTLGFIVPTTISAGDYRVRLRISGRNGAGADAGFAWNSCTTDLAYFGETEDYILRVIENCPVKITSLSSGDVCGSGSVTLNVTGTVGTTEFRWYAAQTGGAPLATTATGTWNTPVISASTTYWVTAFNGSCETLVRTKIVALVKAVPTLTFSGSSTEVCGEDSIVALTSAGDFEIIHLLNENFETGLGTFSNVHNVSNPAVNATTAWQTRTGPYVPTGLTWYPAIASNFGANNFAFVNSDIGGYTCPPASSTCYYVVDNGLVSNTVNSTGFIDLTFKFRMYFDRYYPNGIFPADELMTIDVSTNGGTTWTALSGNITSDVGYGSRFTDYSYNLSAYINQTNLKVRVRYYTSTWANGAAVDDIELFGSKALNTAFQWTGTSLPDAYLDGAATIPYTAGTPASIVYVKPTLAQLETGSYTFTATATLSNGCNVSQNITILNKSKIWKGGVDNNWNNTSNWSPAGVPDANTCVIIPDIATTSNRPSEINTSGSSSFGKTLIVKANGVLKLYANNNLTIGETITVAPTGIIDMENSSNLVQISNVVNTGNINMKRNANVRRQDYVYWSSPVANFASNAVSPGTGLGFQYKWLPTTGGINGFGNWSYANETMVLGKGYCLRAPDSYSTSTAANYAASFIGVPNNGDITVPISRGTYDGVNYSTGVSTTMGTKDDDNWNLVGNPYPSAINAIKFLTLNTNIDGFVNIWTHGTLPSSATIDPFYSDYASNYTATDYITYNATGTSTPLGFNGFIGAGQGFFVSMLHGTAATTENLIFNNDLRRDIPTGDTYNNSQFFRTANAEGSSNADPETLERHRIWIDLASSSGTTARSLVGYVENATNEKDRLFDAFSNEKLSFNIFSLINEDQMLIQGRKLPFDINDKVNIGVKIPQDGLYKIAIGAVDGMFLDAGQNIYLEDKLLNIIFNLKEAPYSFISNRGVIKDRFIIRYAKDAKANITEVTNQFNVYDNNVLTAESGKLKIKNIQIFDVLGKELLSKNNVNNKTYQVTTLNRTNSLMIVKVTLEDNSEEVRKVIY